MSPTPTRLDRRTLLALGTAFTLPVKAAAAVAETGDPFIGSARAPVTTTLWFDFQCPYCKILWRDAIPQVNAHYVRTGKLKLVFSDYSFLGKDSVTAAVIGRAVWHLFPQAYFDWTTAMFDAQDRENGGFGDLNSVARLTVAVPGIDRTVFAAGFNANVKRYDDEVRADFDAGTRAGVRGTPAMRIAGRMEAGALPYDEIAARIDTALRRTR
jgi:protein-disulfide isomerase